MQQEDKRIEDICSPEVFKILYVAGHLKDTANIYLERDSMDGCIDILKRDFLNEESLIATFDPTYKEYMFQMILSSHDVRLLEEFFSQVSF